MQPHTRNSPYERPHRRPPKKKCPGLPLHLIASRPDLGVALAVDHRDLRFERVDASPQPDVLRPYVLEMVLVLRLGRAYGRGGGHVLRAVGKLSAEAVIHEYRHGHTLAIDIP